MKTIQRILNNLNVDSGQYNAVKGKLGLNFGKEPSEKEIALEIIDSVGNNYFKNLDMGLFRNTTLDKYKIFKASGDSRNALVMCLELCYIDLNGPSNRGGFKRDSEFLNNYPPFDPNDKSSVFLAPGIVEYILKLSKELALSKQEISQLFFEHNMMVDKVRNLPLSVPDAWIILESELKF